MMVPALAEQHAAHKARLARMGGPVSGNVVNLPVAPIPAPVAHDPTPAARVRTGYAWTPAELEIMREMAADRWSCRAIATKLRRSAESVQHKARRLGLRVSMRPAKTYSAPVRVDDITALYKLVVFNDQNDIVQARGIMQVCADAHGLSVNDILSECRHKGIVLARRQAIFLAAKDTKLSYAALGRIFNRDPTVIVHAVRMENLRTGQNVRGCGVPR